MSSFQRSQAKYVKKPYRVESWPQYDQGLCNCGRLTVWPGMVDGKLEHWDESKPLLPKPGRQRPCSEHAIETAVALGMVFRFSVSPDRGLLALVAHPTEAGQGSVRPYDDIAVQSQAGESGAG